MSPPVSAVEALGKVSWLAGLDAAALDEIAAHASPLRLGSGECLVAELEAGDELYVIMSGTAEVTVGQGESQGERDPQRVGALGPGDVVGEQALLSFELRSATVTADKDLWVLRIERPVMEAAIRRHPAIAAVLLDKLAARLLGTEQTLSALLSPQGRAAAEALRGQSASAQLTRGSLRRAFRELVIQHRHELPFLALSSFVIALLTVRILAFTLLRLQGPLLPLLRGAFLLGLLLLFLSTGTLLFRFRREVQRLVAIGFGVGFALIFNELSVFLAFDIFWTDMTHRDLSKEFDPVELYTRSEGHYAIGFGLAVLLQITFLRKFYRRAFFILATRLRRLLSSGKR